jgi:hypothetical protein
LTREFDDAVERARTHLRNATVEGLETTLALMDAAWVASGTVGVDASSLPGRLRRALEDCIGALRDGRGFSLPSSLARALSEALATEIARWEKRSRHDPDARLVLRAFLGLRELLWELGLEHDDGPPSRNERRRGTSRRRRASTAAPHEPRVERFTVEE